MYTYRFIASHVHSSAWCRPLVEDLSPSQLFAGRESMAINNTLGRLSFFSLPRNFTGETRLRTADPKAHIKRLRVRTIRILYLPSLVNIFRHEAAQYQQQRPEHQSFSSSNQSEPRHTRDCPTGSRTHVDPSSDRKVLPSRDRDN